MARRKQDWTPRDEGKRRVMRGLMKAYDAIEKTAIDEGLLEDDDDLMYKVTQHFGQIVALLDINPDHFWNQVERT